MVATAKKFTPEVMLQAPRRGPATPSPDGKLAIFSQSTYSFDSHSKVNEIGVLDITNGQTLIISKDSKASESTWLGSGYEVVWLKELENGNTSFIIADASQPGKSYTAGTVPGPVSNLKVYTIKPGMVAIAVAGQANPDGTLYSPKDEQKPHSSARIYDSLFVRHWDRYVTNQRSTIFTGVLQKSSPKVTSRPGRYHLMGFQNALAGSKLESPIPPFGGADHFDVGSQGICFVAKDPDVDPAIHTKCNLYFINKEDFMELGSPEPIKLGELRGFDGAATSPVFSPDGNHIAFLKMKTDGYESDKNHIVLIHNFAGLATASEPLASGDGNGSWDRSPRSIAWANDGKALILETEDVGCGCLFRLDLTPPPGPGWKPTKLTSGGNVVAAAPASSDSRLLFISSNSLVDSSTYTIIDPVDPVNARVVSSLTGDGSMFGLSPAQVSSLWWKGANDHSVHAWMVKPSFYKAGEKYPLAYLIHGGPQGAWNDSWSTRWNPCIFAEQGYIVIAPNPTGSTGYGQGFTDASGLSGEVFHTSRAVALGASYGGYMMNWIQGHDLAKKFKALVCHDGVFSLTAQLSTDELYFPVHDLGGPLWKKQDTWEQWDPSRFIGNWNTPMLVIHSELDYRLTMAEGLAAFNVLQMRGVESRFLSFPDENHWVLKPENSRVWHHQVINWINHYVGLPKLLDKEGKDDSEYVKQARRAYPTAVPALGLD
ncbi:Dipeptidyl-peptidase 5 [Cyphellophora attinorum]|uniref:Dipeptidyl-peptidase V n=1 Tax=Cyphellophora attinorum TaxID=1664694 RepID=A0A0N1H577_9EURO|nr:Dipeptidyl-peptidase 5 [Phialophora attinorum]KPI37437.1 Dipeptidyl-peptidase 5 [Phialophora attinorum]